MNDKLKRKIMEQVEKQNSRTRKLKQLFNIHRIAMFVLGTMALYVAIRGFLDNPVSHRFFMTVCLLLAAISFLFTLYPNEFYKKKRL